ncbi:hypothetical protein Z043_111597 [Scleropages formosus]|uniref:tRNA-splicing endonuclease subunit Sen34 n=1 Tax=Scleropages formosus TaxID=113540 RepID=A0A0P7V4D9_SCLFO|nr:hypothetical protein Z043_111597 [Scleropages formosus]
MDTDCVMHACGSSALLWRAAEARAARRAGIVGTLVGALARQPRQNARLGRPVELLKEEARLLGEEEGWALSHAPERSERSPVPLPGLAEQHRERMEHSYAEQSLLALQERKAVLQRVLAEKQGEEHVPQCSPGADDDDNRAVRDRLGNLDDTFSFPRSAMAVQLSTARAGLGHDPEERRFLVSELLRTRDEQCEIRFRVFRDLRNKGFYLTSGGKFGGDYLVYPGDPLRFHAHFIALCVALETALPLCDVLALSRLGVNVKKTVLLCSPSSEGTVAYTSLQWSGMA